MRCLHVWPEFEKDSNDLHNDTDSSNSEIKSNDNTNHLNFEIDDSTIDFGQCENESRSNCHETKDIKPTATSSSTTPETKDIKPTATSSSAMPETKTKDMTINLVICKLPFPKFCILFSVKICYCLYFFFLLLFFFF